MSTSQSSSNQKFTQTLERLRGELDRLAEVAWSRGEEVWEQFRGGETKGDWSPAVDIVETHDSVIVFMNLPGLNASDVTVTLIGNTLEVSADLVSLTLQTSDRVVRRERPCGHFSRTISLPCAVNHESAIAHAEKGVLKISITKAANAVGRQIPVVSMDPPAGQNS
ncbi:MAG: Hsp20/alpha crystallin family protein [Planctomycetaceae bacterium]|nr:Hsp20/alpha crystallin family protein [Planctomycetaceae bacterium]